MKGQAMSTNKGAIRRFLSTTSGPQILGKMYHGIIWFPSAAWYLRKELTDCASVLDLGCGGNSILRYLPRRSMTIGVEAWKDSVAESKKKGIHDEYILTDIRTLEFKDKSVDAVILLEVLEHLTKEEGTALISRMSKIARKKIILTTPNGFISQEDESNPFQLHQSGWGMSELTSLGFAGFRGCGGLKTLGRRFSSQVIFMMVQSIPQKVAYFLPERANGLMCTKHIING